MDRRLMDIKECLEKCGIEAELRTERVEPYVNCGNVKRIRNRMQFWAPGNGSEIHAFVGKEMGIWYEEAGRLPYLDSNYRYSDKENKVSFPNVDEAMKFIQKVAPAGKAVFEQEADAVPTAKRRAVREQEKRDEAPERARQIPVSNGEMKKTAIVKKRRLL